ERAERDLKTLCQDDWPPESLESVPGCPVCGKTAREVLYADLPDRVFRCAPGAWTYYRCLTCEAAYLDPRPDRESIGLAYATYYTHAEVALEETRVVWKRWRVALRNGYLNGRYGYALQPAWSLGRWLSLPWSRAKADSLVRNLRFPSLAPRLLDVGCGNGAFLAQMRSA